MANRAHPRCCVRLSVIVLTDCVVLAAPFNAMHKTMIELAGGEKEPVVVVVTAAATLVLAGLEASIAMAISLLSHSGSYRPPQLYTYHSSQDDL